MWSAPEAPGPQLALLQLRGRLRRALGYFHKLTGMTAVASLVPSLPVEGKSVTLSPPVHPECASRLRTIPRSPCREQWQIHLRSSRRAARPHRHVCPLGMECSCVPIHLDGQLVGVAKLVAGSRTSDAAFAAAIGVLRLAVSEICQGLLVAALSEQVRALQERVSDFERVRQEHRPGLPGFEGAAEPSPGEVADSRSAMLVKRALAYLQAHYCEPELSLSAVARILDCNPKYLTTRFTEIVGERMHAQVVALRVAHACRLLMETDLRVKEIAHASGFSGSAHMDGAFRRQIGVSPLRYRRIFGGVR